MKKSLSAILAILMLFMCVPTQITADTGTQTQVIAAGMYHSAVINAKGELYTFGLNSSGQLGTGDNLDRSLPVKVMDNARFVSCGGYTTAVIDKNNDLYMFGRNRTGMFGNGSYESSASPVKVMSGVKSVSVGTFHTAVITIDNRLLVAGSNTYGELGTGDTKERTIFTEIANNVMSVSCGYMHTAFITLSHSLYTFGSNTYGQLLYSKENSELPNTYPRLVVDNAKSVSCGYNITYYIDDSDRAYGAGENTYHPISRNISDYELAPQFLCDNAIAVYAAKDCGIVITKAGQMLACGWNNNGQFGIAADSNTAYLLICTLDNIYSVALGCEHTLALTNDGRVLAFGMNTYGQLGTDEFFVETQNGYTVMEDDADDGRIEFGTGWYIKDGELYVWGNGDTGQLGNGRISTSYIPEKLADNIETASIGNYHGAAITTDGDCLWWGSHHLKNTYPEDYEVRQLPNVIMTDCRDVSCGWNYTGIITNDDKLYMFGYNGDCQLGGRSEFIGSPKYITDDVKTCVCTYENTLILKKDGSLYIMGYDSRGLFGPATMTYTSLHKIAENVDEIYYSGADFYIIKDKTDGYSVHATEQSGIDATAINDTIKNAKQVSAGMAHAAYITQNDELYVWGYNWYGQLGVIGQEQVMSPTKIAKNVKSVHCGQYNTIYITQEGKAYVSGSNSNSQLGKPTYGVPVVIMEDCETHSVKAKAANKSYDCDILPIDEPTTNTIPEFDEVLVKNTEAQEYSTSYYSTLDNYQKSMYELLDRNMPSISAGFDYDIFFTGVSGEKTTPSASAISAHRAYVLDHPEKFLLSNLKTTVFSLYYGYRGEYSGYGVDGMLSFTDDVAQADILQDQLDLVVDSIVQACDGLGVADTIEYIVSTFEKTTPLTDFSDLENENTNPYSALCFGDGTEIESRAYSSALKILLDRLGFENYIVAGLKDGNRCYWNVLKMNDNKFYAIDLYESLLTGDSSYILAGEDIMNDGRSYENYFELEVTFPILSENAYTPTDAPMYSYEKPEWDFTEYQPPMEHKNCTYSPDSSHLYMLCSEENGTTYALTQNTARYYGYGVSRRGLEARNIENADMDAYWRIEKGDAGFAVRNVKSGEYLTFSNRPEMSDERSYLMYDADTGKLHTDTVALRLWSTGHGDNTYVLMHTSDAFYKFSSICFHDIGCIGDANTDGKVNTGDAAMVLKYAADIANLTETQKALADTNCDGAVNTGDAVIILKYAAGLITTF